MLGKSGFFFKPEEAYRFKQSKGAHRIDVGGVFGNFKRYRYMGLCCQIIHLIRLNFLKDMDQTA